MILFSLLLSAGLNLSLPEFQPDDVSGNYIVSSYDVSENEFFVTEISSNDLLLSNVESSALGADSTQEFSSDDDLISSIDSFHYDNNRYWELFLDSYPVEVNHSLRSTYVTALSWKFTASGVFASAGGANDHYAYIPVEAGLEYDLSNITIPSFNTYCYGVVNDLTNPTVVTNFGSGNVTELNFVAGQTGYFIFYINYSKEIGFFANWTTVEQESYTLSELGNAVVETKQGLRWLYLLVFFNIVLGLSYKVLDLFGGGKRA